MSKKTRVRHNGSQRSRTQVQKGVELVRPERLSSVEDQPKRDVPEEKTLELAHANASIVMVSPEKTEESQQPISKGNAAYKAPYRAIRKMQQRKPAALITAEDYLYVKHDLITIGVLTAIMMVAMVIFAFVLGIDV